MPTGFLVVANSLKPFQWRRGVYMTFYTTQVHSAFRARWLASSVISQALFTSQPSRRETRNIWSWLHTVESKHIEILLLKIVKRLPSFVWFTSRLTLFDGLRYHMWLCEHWYAWTSDTSYGSKLKERKARIYGESLRKLETRLPAS